MTPHPNERREYFRINHDVIFDFRPVDSDTAEHLEPETVLEQGEALALVTQLRRLDRETSQSLKILADKNRVLGDYLQKLNQKVDLIARYCAFASDASEASERINLSEGGLAFVCDRALYKGNYLAVRLIFLPSYAPVVVFARVTRCDPVDQRYRVAARFQRLPEAYRQELARQILKAQLKRPKIETETERPDNEHP